MAEKQLDQIFIKKVVQSLLDHNNSKSKDGKEKLVDNYPKAVLLVVQLSSEIKKPVLRPIRVKIPHTLYRPTHTDMESTLCFFCKSEDKDRVVAFLKENPIEGLTKVVALNEVKKFYSGTDHHKERRQLLSEHSHFVCDAAIMQYLYNLLGKDFIAHNNYPIPVDFDSKHLENNFLKNIQKVLDSTYMHFKGKNISIKIGRTCMTSAEISSNICQGLAFAAAKFPNGGFKSVHSACVKLPDSESLPFYSSAKNEKLEYLKKLVSTKDAEPSSKQAKKDTPIAAKKTIAKKVAVEAPVAKKVVKKATKAEEVDKGDEKDEIESKGSKATTSSKTSQAKAAPKPAKSAAVKPVKKVAAAKAKK